MSHLDIIRAWKDEQYRNGLSAEERELLPDNPVGAIELSDEEMEQAQGGTTSITVSLTGSCITFILCPSFVICRP